MLETDEYFSPGPSFGPTLGIEEAWGVDRLPEADVDICSVDTSPNQSTEEPNWIVRSLKPSVRRMPVKIEIPIRSSGKCELSAEGDIWPDHPEVAIRHFESNLKQLIGSPQDSRGESSEG